GEEQDRGARTKGQEARGDVWVGKGDVDAVGDGRVRGPDLRVGQVEHRPQRGDGQTRDDESDPGPPVVLSRDHEIRDQQTDERIEREVEQGVARTRGGGYEPAEDGDDAKDQQEANAGETR